MHSASDVTFVESLKQRLEAKEITLPDSFMTTDKLAHTLSDFCKLYNVTPQQLMSSSRQHHLVEVRQLCWYLCYTRLRLTHTLIGRIFNRHHSTVIHGIDRINTLMAAEPVLRDHVNGIELWVNVGATTDVQVVQVASGHDIPLGHS